MLEKLLGIRKNQQGFTMVELMVVIVIIGILSAIAIPNFSGQIERAKIGRAVADLKSVKNLVELYKLENGKYPTTNDFKELMEDNGLTGWGNSDNPMKDPWDRAYYYCVNEGFSEYYLWSEGPEEGANDADNIVASEASQEPLKDQAKPVTNGMKQSSSLTGTTP
ncbi:type II secretion system protein GspG [Peptococcaceae bacterium 1198_IL3148]